MSELSYDDKMRIQTLREQRLGPKAIMKLYPDKNWKLCTVKSVCRRIDETGSAVVRKPCSGRPKTERTASNIVEVIELLCSVFTRRPTLYEQNHATNSERART